MASDNPFSALSSAPPLPSSPSHLRINVRLLDESTINIAIARDSSVTTLKSAISLALGGSLPEWRQRLIFRGKMLGDGSPLSAYGIDADGLTIHLVARPADATVSSPDYKALLSTGIRSPTLPSPLRNEIEAEPLVLPPAASEETTPLLPHVQRLREEPTGLSTRDWLRTQTEAYPHFPSPVTPSDAGAEARQSPERHSAQGAPSLPERMVAGPMGATEFTSRPFNDWAGVSGSYRAIQTINQCLHTIRTIGAAAGVPVDPTTGALQFGTSPASPLEGGGAAEDSAEDYSGLDSTAAGSGSHTYPACSQPGSSLPRAFHVGQHIDVLDTVDQWLEAVIMRIRGNNVYIHYNGWPERWDEWLPTDSNRIAPFRSKSAHVTLGYALGPQPVNVLPRDYAPALPIVGMVGTAPGFPPALDTTSPVHRSFSLPSGEISRPATRVEVTLKSDDVRVILPGVMNACQVVTGLLDNLHTLTSQQVRAHAVKKVSADAGISDTVSEASLSDLELGHESGASDRESHFDRRVGHTAAVLAPLLDRLGRAMSDLSPLIQQLGTNPAFESQCTTEVAANSPRRSESKSADLGESKWDLLEPSIPPNGFAGVAAISAGAEFSGEAIAKALEGGYLSLIRAPVSSPWPENADPRLHSAPGYGINLAGDRSTSLLTLSNARRRGNASLSRTIAHRIVLQPRDLLGSVSVLQEDGAPSRPAADGSGIRPVDD